jgi:hypothetical protein
MPCWLEARGSRFGTKICVTEFITQDRRVPPSLHRPPNKIGKPRPPPPGVFFCAIHPDMESSVEYLFAADIRLADVRPIRR